MRLILAVFISFLPIIMRAQSEWEKPKVSDSEVIQEKKAKPNPDAKYLEGAVPEVNGKVEWKLDLDVPGKSANEIYDIMLKFFTELTEGENQLEGSCVTLVNKSEHVVVANVKEWLVFTDKFLSLDRTKFYYTLIAYCSDNKLTVTMNRISYRYEDGRVKNGGYLYKAEEWISDEYAMNPKKTKLYRGSAKFRRKTIDRKGDLFSSIKTAVLK